MKKAITIFSILMILSCEAMAQVTPGSVLLAYFNKDAKIMYIATVLSIDGNEFTCRFAQSNNEYVFSSRNEYSATVVSSKGGKYPKGSVLNYTEYVIVEDEYGCILNKSRYAVVIAKFPDGKSFLGNLTEDFTADGGFQVSFWHSYSKYSFDKNGVVISQKGGAYPKGTQVKIFCAEHKGVVPVGLTIPNN